MKKIFLVLVITFFSLAGFGQTLLKRGVVIGNTGNAMAVDSVVVRDGKYLLFIGGVQVSENDDIRLAEAEDASDYFWEKGDTTGGSAEGILVTESDLNDAIADIEVSSSGGYEWTEFIVGTTTGAPANADTSFTISQMAGDDIELYRGTTADLHKQWLNETPTNGVTGYRYNSAGTIVVRPAWATGDRAFIKGVDTSAISKITLSAAESSILTGLMGYWKLDETSGSTAADSHSSNNGTISAGVTLNQTGVIGTAFTFNGTSSNVNFSTACRPTEAISIGFWFNIADITSGGDQWFVGNAVYSTGWCGYWVAINSSGQINFVLGTNTATMLDKVYESGLDDGNDHHIVCTWDGTNAYIYVDNVKSTATSYSSDIVYVSACNLHFGSNAYADGTFYGGMLDEVLILNRALSDAEVATLYGKSPYPFE